ncbi:hypothetical protein OG689_44380 [Kitasatospora sp. NBC_00240]|uniref:hypothetical protein n=1 Tax=Kitasatospora sp. NBC_00240 TaxID=2903567 RepID=UPI0022580B7C|nr:hypothetical protein [Kitasatospora sp. NBC_00240]MCX5216176.1 hypothetical protein [Kitasatospora sp. NBC_00240]
MSNITTPAGRTYTANVVIGEHGEAIYEVDRAGQDSLIPVGSFVIHPDYNLFPKVPGLVNVQFGMGSAVNRNERMNVPALGTANLPYVVGHKLVNLEEITDETPVYRLRDVAGAATATGTASLPASGATAKALADLVTALVADWLERSDREQLVAAYEEFLAPQRAAEQAKRDAALEAAKQARVEKLTAEIATAVELIGTLEQQRDSLTPSASGNPDVTPAMDPIVQMNGQITALRLQVEDLAEELAALTK